MILALILEAFRVETALASPGDSVRGKKIYLGLCVQCHGVKGDGNGIAAPSLMHQPANFTDPNTWTHEDSFYINIIKNGLIGMVMPNFWDVLTPQQIRDVLFYEKTFKKSK